MRAFPADMENMEDIVKCLEAHKSDLAPPCAAKVLIREQVFPLHESGDEIFHTQVTPRSICEVISVQITSKNTCKTAIFLPWLEHKTPLNVQGVLFLQVANMTATLAEFHAACDPSLTEVIPYRGTSPIRKRPPPYDPLGTLDIGLR